METKACTKCREVRPLTDFCKDRKRKDGLSLHCKACRQSYHAKNRDKSLAQMRDYYRANRDEISAQRKERYLENREQRIEDARAYYWKNRESRKIAYREWHASNREKANADRRLNRLANLEREKATSAAWYELNREVVFEANRRRRARLADAYTVPFTSEQLASRLAYYGGRCWICGAPWEHWDHVKPLAKGGAHMLANLRPACAGCNLGKGARWPYVRDG